MDLHIHENNSLLTVIRIISKMFEEFKIDPPITKVLSGYIVKGRNQKVVQAFVFSHIPITVFQLLCQNIAYDDINIHNYLIALGHMAYFFSMT